MRDESVASRLVVKRFANGRCSYDEDAKRELIEACLQPGASVAKLAREHGVNANLVHTWISLYRKERNRSLLAAEAPPGNIAGVTSVFMPIVTTPAAVSVPEVRDLRLDITLDNGVQADLRCLSRDDVLAILPVLASLPCSVSTRR